MSVYVDDSGYPADSPKRIPSQAFEPSRQGPTTAQLRARVVAETFRDGACVDPGDETDFRESAA